MSRALAEGDGTIDILAIDPITPTTLYAAGCCRVVNHSHVTGIFKSTDGGVNWDVINTGLNGGRYITALAIDPKTPSTIYAASADPFDHGVYKTTDGGANWSLVNSGLSGAPQALAINPANPSVVYAATRYTSAGGGVFATLNSGNNWFPINTGLTGYFANAVTIDPETSSTLYVGTSDRGLFKTADGGANWFAVNSGMTNSTITGLAIDPWPPVTIYAAMDNGVAKSTNGGESWTDISAGLPQQGVDAVMVNFWAPSTLYAGTDIGVFATLDRGENWFPISNGLPASPNSRVNALAMDTWTGVLYAGTVGGLFSSTDGGITWGGHNTVTTTGLTFDPASDTLWVTEGRDVLGGSSSIFKFVFGQPVVLSPTGLPQSRFGVRFSPVAIDPSTPSTVYIWAAALGGVVGVFKSTDGGNTWSRVSADGAPLPGCCDTLLTVDSKVPSTFYIYGTTQGGVLKSTDGGVTWAGFQVLNGSQRVTALTFDPWTATTIYAGTAGSGVFVLR